MATYLQQEKIKGWFFVLPLVAILFGLIAYPLISAFFFTLQQKRIGLPARWVGFENYKKILFEDPYFWKVLYNSTIYTVSSVSGKLVIGMIMALALNRKFKGRNFIRGCLLFPWILPAVVSVLIWRWMLDDMNGVINAVLMRIGLINEPVSWLGNVRFAMPSAIMVNIWQGFPFFGITLLAAMQGIPNELFEAAAVDGASWWQQFLNITLPGIKYVVLIDVILSTIWTYNAFPLVWVLTQGGPVYSTHIFGTYTYEIAMMGMNLGKGVTISMTMTPIFAVVIIFFTRYMMREVR